MEGNINSIVNLLILSDFAIAVLIAVVLSEFSRKSKLEERITELEIRVKETEEYISNHED